MVKATRWYPGVFAVAAILLAGVATGSAQVQETRKASTGAQDGKRVIDIDAALQAALPALKDKNKKPYEKHDAAVLNETLRDVINTGVKLFNEQGDYAGCYRLFQGSLLTVRPFLAKDLQGKIDTGIASAEKMPSFADRAFELRRVLDEVRASTKSAGSGVAKNKEPAGDKGQVSGTLTLDGKAVAGGYFVTLVGPGAKKFSSAIQKDGSFQFKTPIPAGKYSVAIEPIPGEKLKGTAIPPRYSNEAASGIVIEVQAGPQRVDLNLPK